jgi:hypothetical protein
LYKTDGKPPEEETAMPKDLIGKKFNKLTVIESLGLKSEYAKKYNIKRKNYWWLCVCDCGKQKEASTGHLTTGRMKSCGCVSAKSQLCKQEYPQPKNNFSLRTKMKRTLLAMVWRCHVCSYKNFSLYGGRGISVCDRWRNSVDAFVEDMGFPPTIHHQIDRIDNNGNYEPSNCRWATRAENNRNKRTNVFVMVDGEKTCLRDACIKFGLQTTHVSRKKRQTGMSHQEAFDYFRKKKESSK